MTRKGVGVDRFGNPLNPIYTPASDGKCALTFKTAHDGHTLRFPLPRYPYRLKINCLYAALRNALVELSSWSFRMSLSVPYAQF